MSDSVWEPRFMTGRTLSNIPHEAAHVFVDGLRRALRAAARPVRQDVAPPQKKETARRVPGGDFRQSPQSAPTSRCSSASAHDGSGAWNRAWKALKENGSTYMPCSRRSARQ